MSPVLSFLHNYVARISYFVCDLSLRIHGCIHHQIQMPHILQHDIETSVTATPFRVTVTLANGTEELTVRLDDEMTLVDVER